MAAVAVLKYDRKRRQVSCYRRDKMVFLHYIMVRVVTGNDLMRVVMKYPNELSKYTEVSTREYKQLIKGKRRGWIIS